jgi:hypothetical protein
MGCKQHKSRRADVDLFGQFVQMLNSIPPKAVIRAVQDECQMLENAAFARQAALSEDAISILIFGRFLNAAKSGISLSHSILPTKHVTAFRDIVARLTGTRQLSLKVKAEFEKAFSGDAVEKNMFVRRSGHSRANPI